MPDYVRQGLLRDAVDDELLFRLQRRQRRRDPALHVHAAYGAPRRWSAPPARSASPRSSSASGRRRRAIPRTSSRLARTVSRASATIPSTCRRRPRVRRGPAAGPRPSTPGRPRRAAPARPAAARSPEPPSARRALSRRSTSRRPSISLNAAVSSATSGSAASIVARVAGTQRIDATHHRRQPAERPERPPQQRPGSAPASRPPRRARRPARRARSESSPSRARSPAPAWPAREPRRSSRTRATATSCREPEIERATTLPGPPAGRHRTAETTAPTTNCSNSARPGDAASATRDRGRHVQQLAPRARSHGGLISGGTRRGRPKPRSVRSRPAPAIAPPSGDGGRPGAEHAPSAAPPAANARAPQPADSSTRLRISALASIRRKHVDASTTPAASATAIAESTSAVQPREGRCRRASHRRQDAQGEALHAGQASAQGDAPHPRAALQGSRQAGWVDGQVHGRTSRPTRLPGTPRTIVLVAAHEVMPAASRSRTDRRSGTAGPRSANGNVDSTPRILGAISRR